MQVGEDEDSTDSILLHESELRSFEEDKFDHRAHVETIEEIIDDVNPSWHIGLFGEWGAGKSTIIDLLYERIRSNRSDPSYESSIEPSDYDFTGTLCVKTDAWKHAENSIRTELVLDLNREIANELERLIGDTAYNSSEDVTSDEDGSPDGILDSDGLINQLYDVEEKEDEEAQPIRDTIREMDSVAKALGGTGLGLIVTATVLIALSVFSIIPPTYTSPLTFIFGTGLLGAIGSVVLSEFQESRYDIDRKLANPQRDWSGAYERIFDEIIATANDRYEEATGQSIDKIVVTVDDVDRCESETAYEILIALKSFLNHDDCIFIIPCDEDALYKHLEAVDDGAYLENSLNQQNFLSKFFETEIEIPKPTQAHLDTFAEQQRQQVRNEVPGYVMDVLMEAEISTPRRITRAINRYVTLRQLAMHRENGVIDMDDPEHARFLAKVSILQEDFPRFHAALERDASQLEEVYAEWESGLEETEHPGTEPLFDDMGIPTERREPLVDFLSATKDVGVVDPQPFFTLSGSPQQFESRFLERLRQDRVSALRSMLSELDPDGDADRINQIVRHIEDQLHNEATRYDVFETVLKITHSLPEGAQREVATAVHEVVVESDATNILSDVDFDAFEAVIANLDPDSEVPDIISAYVESMIDAEDGLDWARFASLISTEQVKQSLVDDEIQAEFEKRLIKAYRSGVISKEEYYRIVRQLKSDCPQLYTPTIVQAW